MKHFFFTLLVLLFGFADLGHSQEDVVDCPILDDVIIHVSKDDDFYRYEYEFHQPPYYDWSLSTLFSRDFIPTKQMYPTSRPFVAHIENYKWLYCEYSLPDDDEKTLSARLLVNAHSCEQFENAPSFRCDPSPPPR